MNYPAVITSGAGGIGKAIVRKFLQNGYAVIIADINTNLGLSTEKEFRPLGKIIFKETDVSSEDSVRDLSSFCKNQFKAVSVLVNNAAIAANKSITELSFLEWEHVVRVNLSGAFLCSKYLVPLLKEAGGSIINISSTRAIQSEPNTEAYSASKGGITALTHALALSLGPEIRVNCISPGWINSAGMDLKQSDHSQHPAGRVGIPEDIAEIAWFLSRPENGFITGTDIKADGGMTRKMIYQD